MSSGYAITSQPTTTVVIKQTRQWNSELFACFDDIGVCLLGTFCGECLMCFLSKKMGEHCYVPICVPGAIVTMRAVTRERHGIQGTVCNDCVCSTFCGLCVLCQLGRELKATGEWST